MESKTSKDVILLGRVEVAVSSFLLAMSLIMILGDLIFHLAGGFLAVIGLGVGFISLFGLIAGIAILKLKYLGVRLNFIVVGVILYSQLPLVITALSDVVLNRPFDYHYPGWRLVMALIQLSVAVFLIVFFIRMKGAKGIWK